MSRPLVLLYHRITEVDRDPHGICVTPDHFAEHLEWLAENLEVASLAESAGGRRAAVITFDDGYSDNALAAAPALQKAGLPATFFITAGRVGSTDEFWWDRLERMLLGTNTGPEHVDLRIAGRRLYVDIRSERGRRRAHWALFWRLRPQPPEEIDQVLGQLADQVHDNASPRAAHRMMTEEELAGLMDHDLFEIGGHTLRHPLLMTQPPSVQRAEIIGCKRRLEELTGGPVSSFSYPYGGPDARDVTTLRLVAEAGFERACAVGSEPSPGEPQLCIPRHVVGDWDGSEFERRVTEWLGGRP